MTARTLESATMAHVIVRLGTLAWTVHVDLAPTTALAMETVCAHIVCVKWDGPDLIARSRDVLATAHHMAAVLMEHATVHLASWARHASKRCAPMDALATDDATE